MIYLAPNKDIQLGGGGASNEHAPSQKAVKTYVDTSLKLKEDVSNKSQFIDTSEIKYPSNKAVKTYVDNKLIPTAISVLGPASVYSYAGQIVRYRVVPTPEYATSYTITSVVGTNVVVTEITQDGFTADFSSVSAGTVTLTVTATTSNGNTITGIKTVNKSWYVPSGVFIQDMNRVLYTRTEWNSMLKLPGDARGIAVGDGTYSFCLHKLCANKMSWSTSTTVKVDVDSLPYTTKDSFSASQDFMGKANTDAIFKYKATNPNYSAPAFEYARNIGNDYYLPAAGELVMICNSTNSTEIAACSDVIDGNLSSMFSRRYLMAWSSTQYSESEAWLWDATLYTLIQFYKIYGEYYYALGCVDL